MKFESQQRRNFWSGMLFGTITDFFICYLIISFINDDTVGDELMYALFAVLALWILQMLLGLKNTLCQFAYHYWFERQQRISSVEAALKKANIPVYEEYFADAIAYFQAVIKDENSELKSKIFASEVIGLICGTETATQRFIRLSVLEAALENYQGK